MIKLPNDFRCSKLSVYPKNWQSNNPKMNMDWYISYRFYDPRQKKPKQIVIKRMNQYKSASDRQNDVVTILKAEMEKLLNGFNPFERNSISMFTLGAVKRFTVKDGYFIDAAIDYIDGDAERRLNIKAIFSLLRWPKEK